MNIKLIKLKNGEEFCAEVVEQDDDNISVNEPIVLAAHPDPQKQGQFMLAPWCAMSAERSFEFKMSEVLFVKDPQEDIVNGYSQQFGGIVVPNKQILKG